MEPVRVRGPVPIYYEGEVIDRLMAGGGPDLRRATYVVRGLTDEERMMLREILRRDDARYEMRQFLIEWVLDLFRQAVSWIPLGGVRRYVLRKSFGLVEDAATKLFQFIRAKLYAS